MKKILNFCKKSLIVICALLFLSIVIVFYTLWYSKPVMTGLIKAPGLVNAVRVVRDNEGIPHIYAKTETDANFALGYVMASDRLFQYDVIRRVGSGTSSEIFGDKTLGIDILFKTIGDEDFFKERISKLPSEVLNKYQAFADGLNYYAQNTVLPIEYLILGTRPKKFEVIDAYYVYLYLAYSFSPMLKDKPMYSEILKNINNRNFEMLTSNNKPVKVTKLINEKVFNAISKFYNYESMLEFFGPIEGSNAWVISGAHTKSKKPILSSDPHVTFTLPNLWYEAHVKVENGYEFYGHYLPLIPFAAMGHNRKLGWGLTMSYIDDMDLIQEKSSLTYERQNELRSYKNMTKLIYVKNENLPYELKLKYTDSGPIIDHLISEQTKAENISLYWSLYFKDNYPIQAFFNLSHANSLDKAREALALAKSPGMNILYADSEGNTAHLFLGSLFKRRQDADSDIITSSDFDFFKDYSNNEKPHAINPSSGILVSTNDRPRDEVKNAKLNIRGIWYPKNRHDSVEYLLKEQLLKGPFDMELMKSVQTSTLDIHARDYVSKMVQILEKSQLNEFQLKALYELKNWNYLSDRESVGATIYHHFDFFLLQIILDELPEKQRMQYLTTTSSWYLKERLFQEPMNLWWDKLSTSEIESMDDIILETFKTALVDLEKQLGPDIENWRWDRLHTIEFPHPFGMNKYLKSFFNKGPYPVAGSINVINHYRRKGVDDGHKVKSGPSTRRIVDFSKPEKSLGILPLGNSGHMLSPFFDNQRERFLNGQYRAQLLNESDIEQAKSYELTLEPVNQNP